MLKIILRNFGKPASGPSSRFSIHRWSVPRQSVLNIIMSNAFTVQKTTLRYRILTDRFTGTPPCAFNYYLKIFYTVFLFFYRWLAPSLYFLFFFFLFFLFFFVFFYAFRHALRRLISIAPIYVIVRIYTYEDHICCVLLLH